MFGSHYDTHKFNKVLFIMLFSFHLLVTDLHIQGQVLDYSSSGHHQSSLTPPQQVQTHTAGRCSDDQSSGRTLEGYSLVTKVEGAATSM